MPCIRVDPRRYFLRPSRLHTFGPCNSCSRSLGSQSPHREEHSSNAAVGRRGVDEVRWQARLYHWRRLLSRTIRFVLSIIIASSTYSPTPRLITRSQRSKWRSTKAFRPSSPPPRRTTLSCSSPSARRPCSTGTFPPPRSSLSSRSSLAASRSSSCTMRSRCPTRSRSRTRRLPLAARSSSSSQR